MRACILDPISRFVRKLAKVHLPGMRGRTQHVNICAGTKNAVLCAADDDRSNFRVLEPKSLQRIMQLDVHTEIVGIQFQLVTWPKPPVLAYIHEQGRDWTVNGESPVPVTGRIRLVVHVVGFGWGVMTDCGIHESLLHQTSFAALGIIGDRSPEPAQYHIYKERSKQSPLWPRFSPAKR
jgi:hypothetical protein